MKKHIRVAVLLTMAAGALAIPVMEFKSWDDLTQRSPEIILARCTATRDFILATNPLPIVIDGMIDSDIEVISVLKGNSKPGLSRMATQYWPYRGQYFLVFANNEKDQFNIGYTAIEPYRVIPLGHFFYTNQLAGKTLAQQVELILKHRLEELASVTDERARLQTIMKRGSNDGRTATNPPPKVPAVPPPREGKFYRTERFDHSPVHFVLCEKRAKLRPNPCCYEIQNSSLFGSSCLCLLASAGQ